MKILVTGANGFVGRHLVEHLLEVGHEVSAGVRSPGSAPRGSLEVVIGNIGPDTDWSGVFREHDAVIHLAARVHVMKDISADPLEEFRRVNAMGTERLARAAASQSVRRLVFLSTVKVNGEITGDVPFTANDVPHPQDPYGISKYEAEVALRAIAKETALDVVIVRTPLVYGPYVGGNFVKMLTLAHRGVPFPLGSVNNRRTMASVWNLVDLLEKASTDASAVGGLVLAGDAFSPSTAELSRQVSTAMGKKSRVFPFPLSLLRFSGRVAGKSAVISRLTDSLEVESGSSATLWTWIPPHTFAHSIERTVDWYLSEKGKSARGQST